jgi:hypothetical protein
MVGARWDNKMDDQNQQPTKLQSLPKGILLIGGVCLASVLSIVHGSMTSSQFLANFSQSSEIEGVALLGSQSSSSNFNTSLPPPPPSSGFNQTKSIINAGNMHYTWIGNQWVPPDGVPIYSVTKMRDVFETYNIVWAGDSTARRAYMTLRGMLNAPDSSDISISEINDARVIDRGKKGGFGAENCTQNVDLPWANNETT